MNALDMPPSFTVIPVPTRPPRTPHRAPHRDPCILVLSPYQACPHYPRTRPVHTTLSPAPPPSTFPKHHIVSRPVHTTLVHIVHIVSRPSHFIEAAHHRSGSNHLQRREPN